MDIATLKENPQSTPYTKSLRVHLLDVGEWTEYKRPNQKMSSFLKFVAADGTGTLRGIAYDMDSQQALLKGANLLLRGFMYSSNQLKLTSSTRAFKCMPVDVPEQVRLENTSSPKKTMEQIQASPVKSSVIVEGTVVKEEAVKSLTIGSRQTKVKEITIQDNTGEVKVSLWEQRSDEPVRCGDSIRIEDGIIKFSQFHGENTISVNSLAAVKKIELKRELQKCQILAVSTTESAINVVVEHENGNEQELICQKDVICSYLHLDMDSSLDDIQNTYVSPLLPIICSISVSGNNILSIK